MLWLHVAAAVEFGDGRFVGRPRDDDEGERAGHLTQSITDVVNRFPLKLESVDFENFVAGEELSASFGGSALDHAADDNAFALVADGGAQRLVLLHDFHHAGHVLLLNVLLCLNLSL